MRQDKINRQTFQVSETWEVSFIVKNGRIAIRPYLLIFLILLAACQQQNNNTANDPTDAPPPPAPATVEATTEPEPTEELEPTEEPEPTAIPTIDPNDRLPYQDPNLPTEERVEDLLGRMTLEEKIGQMTLIENGSIRPEGVTDGLVGAVLSGGGGGPAGANTPDAWLAMVNEYQSAALQTRLGIPILYGVDAVHGHSNVETAVIFPHNVGLGATHNPDLLFEIGRITALETIATGIYWDYAPVLAVSRDVRWGRAYESYSEDPDLVADLATAYFLGLQGIDGQTTDLSHPLTLLATPKHWVGDGGTIWGSSTTGNYQIDRGETFGDEDYLRRIHIAPYLPIFDLGAMNVMISYSSWDGIKLHGHDYLINGVLKDELGYSGFIVSDWQAIDEIPGDYYSDVVTSVNAGIDMNMVPYDLRGFTSNLRRAVNNGEVSQERIDDAVRRILTAKFELGLFDNPITEPTLLADVGSEEHRAVARQAVRESLVLLKNENEALPIASDTGRILVAGQHADDVGLQSGGWTIEWQGTSGSIGSGTSILSALEATVSDSTEVIYDRFGQFDGLEGGAEIGIVVMGERPYAEGVGDRNDLSINTTMIERMAERVDKVVVILITGRPLVITEALPLANAWVVAWLPGSEGTGVTDVLFGEYDFTGTLAFSWQRSMAQLPFDFDNMPTEGCDAPLFPFGYGLTYDDEESVELLDC